jgi:hypothetical protein
VVQITAAMNSAEIAADFRRPKRRILDWGQSWKALPLALAGIVPLLEDDEVNAVASMISTPTSSTRVNADDVSRKNIAPNPHPPKPRGLITL